MDFISKTIAPAGRNKYGYYYAATNITKSVVNTTYGGNSTTTTIADTGTTNTGGDNLSFFCNLSKTNVTFDSVALPQGVTAATEVVAYVGFNRAPALICDMDAVEVVMDGDMVQSITVPQNMGVQGLVEGLAIRTITNNGTSATSITFIADNSLTGNSGTIRIPVVVYKREDAVPVGDDVYDWWDSQADCEQLWLDYSWNVNRVSSSNYYLDLSNENAGVNVDTAGTIYSASTATLACSATTYLGGAVVPDVVYSISILPKYNAHGVSIGASTGVLAWESNFGFDGPNLPIDVIATVSDYPVATKTMTINKNYPGADGSPAETKWIVTSHDVVKYNPNTNEYSANEVVGQVYKQVGDQAPAYDSEAQIWRWYNDYETGKTSAYGMITGYTEGVSGITFALMNSNGDYYEKEEVPVIAEGKNGATGPQGPAGQDGTDGDNGESAWYLSLTNDNASVNCKSDGTISESAFRPSTELWLYHGSQSASNWTIDVHVFDGGTEIPRDEATGDWSSHGIAIGEYTYEEGDVIYVSHYSISTTSLLQFTASTMRAIIYASDSDGIERDHKVFTITKSLNGASGAPATSYWLILSSHVVICDSGGADPKPSTITASCMKQVGDDGAKLATDATIVYNRVSRTTGDEELTPTTSSTITITPSSASTYSAVRFRAYVDGQERDMQEVAIMMNGAVGPQGSSVQGPAIRGPYDYAQYSAVTRCWCSGEADAGCDDCGKWIDVVLKDGEYYYCNYTYYDTLEQGFTDGYWDQGEKMDFIAAGLIVASGASINYISNNTLYLMSGDTITGGARGGSGYTFWAGARYPEDAPFRVDTNGSFSSTTGLMGGWAYNTSGMSWDYTDGDYSEDAQFGRNGLSFSFETVGNRADFEAGTDGIKFSQEMPNGNALSIDGGSVTFTGDGAFNLGKVIQNKNASGRYGVKVYDNLSVHDNVTFDNNVYNVVGSAYGSKPKIAFVTTSSTYTTYFSAVTTYIDNSGPNTYRSGYWAFNGDMKVANWSENGGSGMYMVLATTAMSRVEIEITDFAEAEHTYKTWRTGAAANDYVVDVLFSGGTLYRCNTSYTGNLNYDTNTSKWSQESWETIRNNRYYWGDEMKASVDGWPEENRIGIPRRWAGMWCACDSSNPTSNSSFIPTGIYGPTFNNRKGDTLYFEV